MIKYKNLFLSALVLLLIFNTPLISYSKNAAQVVNLLETAGNEYKASNYLTAIDYYKKALDKDSNNPITHFGLGASYLATKNYSMAIEHLLRALELNPALVEAYFSLAYAYQAARRETEAFTAYRQGLGFDLTNKLPHSKFWNEVVMGSADDEDGLSLSSLDMPRQSNNKTQNWKNDNQPKIAIVHGDNYYKSQISDIQEEIEREPESVSLKYKLALMYLKIHDITNAEKIQKEISGKNDEFEEDLLERISKLKNKSATSNANKSATATSNANEPDASNGTNMPAMNNIVEPNIPSSKQKPVSKKQRKTSRFHSH